MKKSELNLKTAEEKANIRVVVLKTCNSKLKIWESEQIQYD